MLKELAIDLSDLIASFAKWRARVWLTRSQWWSDFAESIETGAPVSEIRKGRKDAGADMDR